MLVSEQVSKWRCSVVAVLGTAQQGAGRCGALCCGSTSPLTGSWVLWGQSQAHSVHPSSGRGGDAAHLSPHGRLALPNLAEPHTALDPGRPGEAAPPRTAPLGCAALHCGIRSPARAVSARPDPGPAACPGRLIHPRCGTPFVPYHRALGTVGAALRGHGCPVNRPDRGSGPTLGGGQGCLQWGGF